MTHMNESQEPINRLLWLTIQPISAAPVNNGCFRVFLVIHESCVIRIFFPLCFADTGHILAYFTNLSSVESILSIPLPHPSMRKRSYVQGLKITEE